MRQDIKIVSSGALDSNERRLRNMRIVNMETTRPDDMDEILRKIGDHAAFGARVQTLIFVDLMPDSCGG